MELVRARVYAFRLCLLDRCRPVNGVGVFSYCFCPMLPRTHVIVYLCVCCVFSAFCVRTTINHYHQLLTAINRGRPWCPASDSRS